ncbi:MAG TPA: hypothetical protein VKB02_13055 [Pyrinomonadaceae bacterium]|nr:hypothetical protein [Pyrinomonadaceae bacterium]
MNRNQKIALGCGGAGCLGLIVVVIAGGLIYFFATRSSTNRNYSNRNSNINVSTNRNSNSNDNSDLSSNANDNSTNSSSTTASSMSDDDKHKLYQAAAMTGDTELVRRVSIKLGLMDGDYTPGENYQTFLTEHVGWVMRNADFIQAMNSPEKARAYVNENFPQ